MRIVVDYRQRAEECREIAQQMSFREHRDRLISMAEDWERLAQTGEDELNESPSTDDMRNPLKE
jgi:hypothetical protein